MDDFFVYDPLAVGSKGLLFVGKQILVYRRDNNTTNHPHELDVPGGGPEASESPFETFRREVKEEFNLDISQEDIRYVRKYPSIVEKGKYAYFPVAHLPAMMAASIKLGDEGSEFLLMSLEEYLARTDAWEVFQQRAADYARLQRHKDL